MICHEKQHAQKCDDLGSRGSRENIVLGLLTLLYYEFYLCSTGSFSNMRGGLVSWPKESTNRIILENWAFYVVNVFMRTLQIHKSPKMLFIVHKCFLPNNVQNYKYSRTRCSTKIMFHHSLLLAVILASRKCLSSFKLPT